MTGSHPSALLLTLLNTSPQGNKQELAQANKDMVLLRCTASHIRIFSNPFPLLLNVPQILKTRVILLRIRVEVSHQAFCSINPWVFEKPYKKGRFLRVLALTKSIGF